MEDDKKYEQLWKRAKNYGERMGLGRDAEDFAQEVVLKSHSVGAVKLDWMFKNYRDYHRADKRILSSPEGPLSAFRTRSIDAPLDETDSDSARLHDVIGDAGSDVEAVGELEHYNQLIKLIIETVTDYEAKKWAENMYMKFIEENL